MIQATPQSWGRLYWAGGFRIECNFCTFGRDARVFNRKASADRALANHCMEKHSNKTEVRVWMISGEKS